MAFSIRIIITGFLIFYSYFFSIAQINIYIASAPSCGPCHELMQHLDEQGIAYTQIENIKNDSLRHKLQDLLIKINYGIPISFIDTTGNNDFEINEPMVDGSTTAEGVIQILLGKHPTISKKEYLRMTALNNAVFEKFEGIKFEGELKDNAGINDSIRIDTMLYKATVKKDYSSFEVEYTAKDSTMLYHYCFKNEIIKSEYHFYNFIRIITPIDPDKRNNIKTG